MASKDPLQAAVATALPETAAIGEAVDAIAQAVADEQANAQLAVLVAENQEALEAIEASLEMDGTIPALPDPLADPAAESPLVDDDFDVD